MTTLAFQEKADQGSILDYGQASLQKMGEACEPPPSEIVSTGQANQYEKLLGRICWHGVIHQ